MRKRTLILPLLCLIALLASFVGAQTAGVDWPRLNPRFAGAHFVGDAEACRSCHEEVMTSYEHTVHSRLQAFDRRGDMVGECESCHGPRSLHVEDPDAALALTPAQYTVACQQCHQGGGRIHWQNSLHDAHGMECVSCHTVMTQRSAAALLSHPTESALCAGCHADVAAQMRRQSRHPVLEGKLACSSCHNPHGTASDGMLIAGTGNETCYSCHQEMRGPFLWEHPPVREDCQSCHEPHGSTNRFLLTTLSSTLCISCHQYGGHINQYRYNRVSTPYGNGCANCHVTFHGSNHPSGAKFNR